MQRGARSALHEAFELLIGHQAVPVVLFGVLVELRLAIGDVVLDLDVGENADADVRLLERSHVVGAVAAHETVGPAGFGGADGVSLLLRRHASEDGHEGRERFENGGLVEEERACASRRANEQKPFSTRTNRACSAASAAGSATKVWQSGWEARFSQ